MKANHKMSIPNINHTQIPNKYLDEYLSKHITASIKCFLAICRKTIGWHKETDKISLSQFHAITGMGRSTILRGLRELEKDGLIKIIASKGSCSTYEINYDWFHGETSTTTDQSHHETSTSPTMRPVEPLTSPTMGHTKESNINKYLNKGCLETKQENPLWLWLYEYKKKQHLLPTDSKGKTIFFKSAKKHCDEILCQVDDQYARRVFLWAMEKDDFWRNQDVMPHHWSKIHAAYKGKKKGRLM